MTLILSGTDGLSDVDGTAAAPAIRGTDANTGIFFPAADTIAFAEGGAEVMRINSSGNVGIGTTSPTARLTLASGTNEGAVRVGDNATYYGELARVQATDEVRLGAYGPSQNLVFYTNASERARVESTGNFTVKRQITSFTTNGFGVFRSGSSLDVADGSTITLSSGSGAQLICVLCGTSGNGGTFFANYNVTVSQIGGSATQISTTDAGVVDIAVYKSINNNTVTFKNRSGFTKNYTISIFCADNGDTV
jgi:hypothetical protein